MNFSLFDLAPLACFTRSRIFAAVDSPKAFSTFALTTPDWFTHPERIWSPTVTSRGADSPVRATVSRLVEPSMITPSIGTFSPGFMTIVSPTATSSGSTVMTFPSRSTFAVSGLISRSCEMAREEFPSAIPSNSSPTW